MYLPQERKNDRKIVKTRNKLAERAKIMVIWNIINFFQTDAYFRGWNNTVALRMYT